MTVDVPTYIIHLIHSIRVLTDKCTPYTCMETLMRENQTSKYYFGNVKELSRLWLLWCSCIVELLVGKEYARLSPLVITQKRYRRDRQSRYSLHSMVSYCTV